MIVRFSLLLLLIIAAATPNPRYFRYECPLVNIPSQPGQACAVLDDSVFANAGPQLASLRLYRGETETPFAIDYAGATEVPPQSTALLNRGIRGSETTFDAAMPDGSYRNVTLDVDAKDFIATVQVSGSQTQTGARVTSLGSYTIFDFTRQKLGRSTVLHLPESDFHYLHFRVDGPIRSDQITGISAGHGISKPEYLVFAYSERAFEKGRDTVATISAPPNLPIDRIIFGPGARPVSFSRGVTVTVTSPGSHSSTDTEELQPPTIFTGNILRIHSTQNGHKIDEENLAIDVPAYVTSFRPAGTKWTIAIHNQDDAPIQLDSVGLQMIARRLCFDSEPGATYTLYYGDSALSPPHYDYARLFVHDKNAAKVYLGTEQLNLHYRLRPDTRPFTERHPALLWITLIVAILILGGLALRSSADLRQQPK